MITGKEYIRLLCNARGKTNLDIDSKNIFDLPLNQYASTYSTGMKKKLAITAILLQENDYFILDEPFNGVDIQSNVILTEIILKLKELNIATIKDIMEFNDMPTKSYAEIVTEMNTQFSDFYDKYSKVQIEIDKINIIINQAKQQCSYNIEEKAKKLLDDMIWERKKLIKERRVFYHRLKNLDLIEEAK
jgi:ATPase subunit of ABC transporter with duplicated ATPase domains